MKKQFLLSILLTLVVASASAQFSKLKVGTITHGVLEDPNGSVGIGTATGVVPSDKLHVIGNIRGYQMNATNGVFNSQGQGSLSLQLNGVNKLYIETPLAGSTGGFIGINTTSPADQLHINGNVRGNQFNSLSGVFNSQGASNMSFNTNGAARLTIINTGTTAGFVGINTLSPADQLHVNGNVRGNQFNALNGIVNSEGASNLSFNTNGTSRLTIINSGTTAGFVGIGKTNPAYMLDVAGPINATQLLINGAPFLEAHLHNGLPLDRTFTIAQVKLV